VEHTLDANNGSIISLAQYLYHSRNTNTSRSWALALDLFILISDFCQMLSLKFRVLYNNSAVKAVMGLSTTVVLL
jgi:hypothetical protein